MKSFWWFIILAIIIETLGEMSSPALRPFFYTIAGILAVIGIICLIKSPKVRHAKSTREMSQEHKDERCKQQALLSKAYSVAMEGGSFGMMNFKYDASSHNSVVEIHSMDGRQRIYTFDELGYSTVGKAVVYFDLDVVAKFATDHGLLLNSRYYRNGTTYEVTDKDSTARYNTDIENNIFDFTIYSPKYGRKFTL